MKLSRISGFHAIGVILFCSSVIAVGQGKPPKDGDFGIIERQIGLVLNTPEAYEGYTLFAPKHYTRTYLMNNQGGIINTWDSPYEPGQSVHLLPNGHLLHSSFIKGSGDTGGGEGGRIEEYDWEGNLVWEMDGSGKKSTFRVSGGWLYAAGPT